MFVWRKFGKVTFHMQNASLASRDKGQQRFVSGAKELAITKEIFPPSREKRSYVKIFPRPDPGKL